MKMLDVGTKRDSSIGMPEKESKNKIYYPSVTIDKNIEMTMGEKVIMEGVVSGLRNDKYGQSTTIEVRKCGAMEGKRLSDMSVPEIMKMRRGKDK